MKQFKNEEEYAIALNNVEWKARMYVESWSVDMRRRIAEAEAYNPTSSLKDALFLLKLLEEKIEEHNGRCKQKAGQMKQTSFKRNNIEGY